jgi:peptidoglycan/LPS O-acetylase OafA/YrhL
VVAWVAASRRRQLLASCWSPPLALSSLYHFNRDAAWDNWALYFFGSYALGALACWAANAKHAARWLSLIALAVVMALLLDYRSRIAVALVVALALGLASRHGFLVRWPKSSLLAYLGQISYSVFLIHFPVCLIINAWLLASPWLIRGSIWPASCSRGWSACWPADCSTASSRGRRSRGFAACVQRRGFI